VADTNEKSPSAAGAPSELPGGASPPPAAPEAAPVEQDALFRLQMAISDFVLGNWKYGGYALLAVLVVALAYGGWTSLQSSRAQAQYSAIAAIDFKMPKVDPTKPDTDDPTRVANIQEGAKRFAAAAEDAKGAAAVYGWLKSAEAWQRIGKKDEAIAAIQKATAVGEKDLPGFTADAALAAALLDAGKTDEAIAQYSAMTTKYSGFFAEQSMLRLATTQVDAGKKDDAKATITQFTTNYPNSQLLPAMAELSARMGSGT
jgi:predicted negative regulator of RcsB-dependent stress response